MGRYRAFRRRARSGLVRELVTHAASADIAAGIAFDTIEARDWVKASLEDLVPVPAGRFVVHGRHDRDRVAPNKSASKSRPRWRSGPATMARRAAACCCSIMS